MNSLTIIGNLTRDPELRSTQDGVQVCSFSVAVNRPKTKANQDPGADFFNVSAWQELGINCSKYLAKGRKVCVVGPVSVRSFARNDGTAGASLEVKANTVEFLTAKDDGNGDNQGAAPAPVPEKTDAQSGFTQVEDQELPF